LSDFNALSDRLASVQYLSKSNHNMVDRTYKW